MSALPILYRDDWLIAVEKPVGQLVIPADHPQQGDQVTMKILRDQIGQQLHPLHRLDRPTSGVLLFATDRRIARNLHSAFQKHEVQKSYRAVVSGNPEQERFTCSEPLQKSSKSPKKPAETSFRFIEKLQKGLSLLEAVPKTGRYHQIRRHLAHLGHPIVGDYRYAGIEESDRLGMLLGTGTRMLLHAHSLQFFHPITENTTLIHSPLPLIFQKLRVRNHIA